MQFCSADTWYQVQQIVVSHLLNSQHDTNIYIEPLLRLTSRSNYVNTPPSTTSPRILKLLHEMYKHTEVKFYRRIVCRDRLCVTIMPSFLGATDRGTYFMWDNLVNEKEFHTLCDAHAFLEIIEDQIHFSLQEANDANETHIP